MSTRNRLNSFQVSGVTVYIVSLNVGIELTPNIACENIYESFISSHYRHYIIYHIRYRYVTCEIEIARKTYLIIKRRVVVCNRDIIKVS